MLFSDGFWILARNKNYMAMAHLGYSGLL